MVEHIDRRQEDGSGVKAVCLWLLGLALVLTACSSEEQGGVRGARPTSSVEPTAGLTCGELECAPNATCAEEAGEAKCVCVDGYEQGEPHEGITPCVDIDECASGSHDCDVNADCENRPGGFLCRCPDGFLGDGKTCEDVDECEGTANTCDPNAVCQNVDQGFECACTAGFEGDGLGCGDVDECATESLYACATNAHCVNRFGGFACECDPGFEGDGDSTCTALCDTAREDPSVCGEHGLCRLEGFEAACRACEPGFTGDGKSCAAAACDPLCDGAGGDDAEHAVCLSDGSCGCAPGFEGEPGACRDVDECATDNGGCGDNADCLNRDGGHLCACQPGYARDSTGQCVDVDECQMDPGPCHPDAACTNTTAEGGSPGYECACNQGFTGDGSICFDIDECASDGGGCDGGAACVNTRGGHRCECQAPLVGEPGNCHCDLSGLWAMRQDVDTCWKARLIQEGTDQDLISAGEMEATVWELHEITYDGSEVRTRKKGCNADNTPDLKSPLFRETYSSYVPLTALDDIELQPGRSYQAPGLVPGSAFTTPSEAAVVGIDLGDDPLNAPWPASFDQVASGAWLDPDGDGEPGLTLWPRLPSETTDSGTSTYSYLPARPGIGGGGSFFIDQRAGCISVALRVVTHLEAEIETCDRIIGAVINENTQGRVHSCSLVEKGTCNPNDPSDCTGWQQDITCEPQDWQTATRCSQEDLTRLDDDQNQTQNSKATFELVKVGEIGDPLTCADVRETLPPIERTVPTISCTTPE